MDILLQTYYILLPIISTALIGWVGTILKDQRKNDKLREEAQAKKDEEIARNRKANSEGIKLVLRYMLNRYHTEYMIQGKITYAQYSDWLDIYNAYKALHGNSIADDWNADIKKLKKCDSLDRTPVFEAVYRHSLEKEMES